MTDDQTFIVGEILPRIASVSLHKDFQVTVTWEEGSRMGQSDVVDLGPAIMTYKLYAPLRDDPSLFATIHVINYGSALGWGDGEEIDMSAEGVEDLAEQAMTASDFRSFMERHGFTQEAAAAQLGISRRQVNYYLTSKSIPRTIALACAFLDTESADINQESNIKETPIGTKSDISQQIHPVVLYQTMSANVSTSNMLKLRVRGKLASGSHCTANLVGNAVSVVSLSDITSGKANLASLAANKPVIVKP